MASVLSSPRCCLSPACEYAPAPRNAPRKLTPIVESGVAAFGQKHSFPRSTSKSICSTGTLQADSTIHRRLSALPPTQTGSPPARSLRLRDRRIHQASRPPAILIPSSSDEPPTSDVSRNDYASPPTESPELPSVSTWVAEVSHQPEKQEDQEDHAELAQENHEDQVDHAQQEQQHSQEDREVEMEALHTTQISTLAKHQHSATSSITKHKQGRVQKLEADQRERRGRLRSLLATVHELMLETRRARLGHD